MSEFYTWVAWGLTVLLESCYPAMASAREQVRDLGRDPAYALYQDYRYAYDTYVYLFWDESTGAGPEDAGLMTAGGGWNHMGDV